MSVAELSRVTRIPSASLEAIEADRFDELPGEVFVRGFLRRTPRPCACCPPRSSPATRRAAAIAYVTPLPMQTPLQAAREGQGGRRFGVAIAFVLLLILLSLGAVDRPQAARARHAGRAVAGADVASLRRYAWWR